jgi:hypothetical protein
MLPSSDLFTVDCFPFGLGCVEHFEEGFNQLPVFATRWQNGSLIDSATFIKSKCLKMLILNNH